jgi:hypothetical protein
LAIGEYGRVSAHEKIVDVVDRDLVIDFFLAGAFGKDVVKSVTILAIISHGGVILDERFLSLFWFSHPAIYSDVTESFVGLLTPDPLHLPHLHLFLILQVLRWEVN